VLVKQHRLNHATRENLVQLTAVGACGRRLPVVQGPVEGASTFAHVHVPTPHLNMVVSHALDLHKNQEVVELLSVVIPPSATDTEEEMDMDVNVLTQTQIIVGDGLQLDSAPIQHTFTI